jgi:alpha-L-fucosidase
MVACRLVPSLLVIIALSCAPREKVAQAPPIAGPTPSESQLEWHQMETNAFVHFSTNTFTDKEWGYGDESPALFNPTEFDADQWIRTFKEVGFKGVILTCKHHDGFCLWPSEFTDHSVEKSPFMNGEGDVVRAVADACKKYGLKFGIYVSPWERNRSDYGTESYKTYYRNQLTELFTNYGPIFEMWFDGANGGDGYYGGAREKRSIDGSTYYDWPVTLDMVRDLEPNVIFFSDAGPGVRWVGNERGIAGETNWNTITPDTLFAGKAGIQELLNTGHEDGNAWIPAEVDVSIRPGWFYHPDENDKVKTPETLFQIYLTSVGRGSTLLLNIPPDRRGLLHENDVQALKAWRALIDSTFGKNLALRAKAISKSTRGDLEVFSASKTTDNNKETYWATDDGVTRGSIEIKLDQPRVVSYVLLQEYIKLGQRVKSFTVDCWVEDDWKTVATGTTIGYKRILPVDSVTTDKVRISILDARACPLISAVEIY